MIEKQITIDLWKQLKEPITTVQYEADARKLVIHLTSGGLPINVTGASVVFYAIKPDNTVIYNACTIIDGATGEVSYVFTGQTCAAAGRLRCWIDITATGVKQRSQEFVVMVQASVDSTGAIESTSEFTALEEAAALIAGMTPSRSLEKDVNGLHLVGDELAPSEGKCYGVNGGVKGFFIPGGTNQNLLINGNFDVAQRGTSFTSVTTPANNDDTYLLDRWNLISSGNDALDVSQEAVSDLIGSNYAIKLDVETSARAGIVQFIEAKEAVKLKGKYVTLSFKAKSANIPALRAVVLSWAGTADSITSDIVATWAATPTWAANWTAENTPADLAVTSNWTTLKIEGIYVDSATVNNLALAIWIPNAETVGDIVYITQIKLEEGKFATPFIPKTFAEELRDCQRYFEKSYNYSVAPGTVSENGAIKIYSGGGAIDTSIQYRAVKRASATPSVYSYGTGAVSKVRDVTAAADVNYGGILSGDGGFLIYGIVTSGHQYEFQWAVDAEL